VLALTFTLASAKNPGYLEPEFPFMDVLSKVHPCELCPECEVIRTPRSKHCAICNKCIERFDHHCPWINNCVGVNNHNSFFTFIITLLLIIVLIVTSSVIMIVDECAPDKNSTDCPLIELCLGCRILWLRYLMLAVTTLICIFFGFPATLLCSVHLKNYYYGKTTNERFAKSARADSVISETLGSVADLREVLNEDDITSDQLAKL